MKFVDRWNRPSSGIMKFNIHGVAGRMPTLVGIGGVLHIDLGQVPAFSLAQWEEDSYQNEIVGNQGSFEVFLLPTSMENSVWKVAWLMPLRGPKRKSPFGSSFTSFERSSF